MEKKITVFVLVPLVLTISIVSLFFAVTDPTTWPESRTLLSASDTRRAPAVSTVWCESLVLSSDHDFVAYKTRGEPALNTKLLKYAVNIQTSLNRRRHHRLELRYFMLPGSMISVLACSSDPGAYVRIYRGLVSDNCLFLTKRQLESSEYESEESEEDEVWTSEAALKKIVKDKCQSPIRSQALPLFFADKENPDCSMVHPISVNVTAQDNYVLLFTNENPTSNRIKVEVSLDRTTYNINKSKDSIHICNSGSYCTVPLTFASREKVLIWMPSEQDAGRVLFTVYSRCRPRISLFAVLTILVPIVLSFLVAFAMFKDRKSARSANFVESYGAPLLVGRDSVNQAGSICLHNEAPQQSLTEERRDSNPPSYEMVYGESPPPPYSSLKAEAEPK